MAKTTERRKLPSEIPIENMETNELYEIANKSNNYLEKHSIAAINEIEKRNDSTNKLIKKIREENNTLGEALLKTGLEIYYKEEFAQEKEPKESDLKELVLEVFYSENTGIEVKTTGYTGLIKEK